MARQGPKDFFMPLRMQLIVICSSRIATLFMSIAGRAGRDSAAAAEGPVQAAAGALHPGGWHRRWRPEEGVLPAAAGGAAVPRLRHAHLPAGASNSTNCCVVTHEDSVKTLR